MNLKVTALWIVLCYSMMSLNADTSVTHKHFRVITDQRRTDKKTCSYLQRRKSFFGRAWFYLSVTPFDHICKIKYQIQSEICRKTLRFDENGFYIDSTVPLMAGCTTMPYTIRFSTRAKAETMALTTITCPTITYPDLETDEYVTLPYVYKMSNAGKSSSAVMYVQPDKESNEMYPIYFLEHINFKKMKSDKYFERSKSLDPLAETELSNRDDIISTYLIVKQTNLPYVKFARLYSSMNICGRPRPQKIYLCRRCIKQQLNRSDMEFDLAGYNEDKCKRYNVSLSEKDGNQHEHSQLENELLIFRCPPVRTIFRSTRSFFYIYYVSSNLEQHSLTLYIRENQRGKLPKFEANIHELQMVPIVKDMRRQRFLPAPPKINGQSIRTQKSYRVIEDEINALGGETAMPSALIQYEPPTLYLEEKINEKVLQIIYPEKWLLDRVTISFSKVKSTKLIYQRFTRTYKSIDICSLSIKQRTLLCNEAFKKEKVPDKKEEQLPFNEDSQSICTKNLVRLSAIDADELETDLFSMWECHGNMQNTQNTYFVGKNHLKNAATIYARVQIRANNYFYPNVLIAGINKYGLVKDEIEKKIKDRSGG